MPAPLPSEVVRHQINHALALMIVAGGLWTDNAIAILHLFRSADYRHKR